MIRSIVTIVALLMLAIPSSASASDAPHKAFVCKYVGTPGDDERLQTGQNPIDVDFSAIDEDPVVVGSFFKDAQGRSFVLAIDVGQDEPSIDDCPPPDNATPTPKTTEPPTSTPTEPPTETPSPTPTVTPTPTSSSTPTPTLPEVTPTPPTPTPSVIEVDQFSLEVCPDLAAIIRGDAVDTVVESIPPGSSAIRFRAVGAILLIALHVRIDGNPVVLDGDGVVLVSPGTHAWSISNQADTEVLAAGEVDCPVCGKAATPPPPNDVTNPPRHTVPPTDTLSSSSSPSSPNLNLVLVILALLATGALLIPRRR